MAEASLRARRRFGATSISGDQLQRMPNHCGP